MGNYKKNILHASLFSGIGGFDLAAEWMGWENVFHCELNDVARKVLKYYWTNSESFTDITKTDFKKYANRIDVLSGGFPCQPFSIAGQRNGTNDDRFLWPEMRRAYNELQPTWVICENVSGLISMEDPREFSKEVFYRVENRKIIRLQEIDDYEAVYVRQTKMLIESICKDFEKDGYEVFPFIIPAASVEAPHRRDRVWIIAHSNRNGFNGTKNRQSNTKRDNHNKTGTETVKQFTGCGGKADVADPKGHRLQRGGDNGLCTKEENPKLERSGSIRYAPHSDSQRLRQKSYRERKTGFFGKKGEIPDWHNWPTEPSICGRNDGLPTRLDGITFSKWRQESIKAFGNAIVPQIALEIYKTIQSVENNYER